MTKSKTTQALDIPSVVADILSTIKEDRERQIVSGRFGLRGRKETLEEIGQRLGITRERVRQIEKQVVEQLPNLKHPHFERITATFNQHLEELGRVAPVHELAARFGLNNQSGYAQVSFLAHLLPDFEVVLENDHFHHSVALKSHHDHKQLHKLVNELVKTIRKLNQPLKLEVIQSAMSTKLELHHLGGLMRSAKQVTNLDEKWGHVSNPLVNPKSIRDKIYVILQKTGKPMHFTAIGEAIKSSNFKRKNVTTQAIHNELIKDERFILIGRGIYGLAEWGYSKGTVSEVIEDILKSESPLHRDEIIKRVLKERQVKPTTIVLNLQGKSQFKRVAKATYALAE